MKRCFNPKCSDTSLAHDEDRLVCWTCHDYEYENQAVCGACKHDELTIIALKEKTNARLQCNRCKTILDKRGSLLT